jgi:hypothetical protein
LCLKSTVLKRKLTHKAPKLINSVGTRENKFFGPAVLLKREGICGEDVTVCCKDGLFEVREFALNACTDAISVLEEKGG